MDTAPAALRIDRWLWAARFFKSRSLAAAACAGGKVDLNGEAAKPARLVRAGDLVAVTLPHGRRIARVRQLGERRGPPSAARALYEDLTPPAPPAARRPLVLLRAPGSGRPTKRERRALDRLRGG
jgi:ribosome-associated heat shock protein Hsp15